MIRRKQDMRVEMCDRLRNGEGTVRLTNLVEPNECFDKVNLCALVELEPGQSVGVHSHGPDAELYYLLKGTLTVTDNGVESRLEEGDAMFTGDGGTHSARNDGDRPATLMAVVLP